MEHSLIFGEFAAIVFSFFIALSAVYYDDSVKKIGAYNTNALRIIIYFLGVLVVYTILFGSPIPGMAVTQFLFLGLSAAFGLVIGDLLFFSSLIYINAWLALLVSSPLVPIIVAVTGYFFLDESLSFYDILGITITLIGILIVLLEKPESVEKSKEPVSFFGIFIVTLSAFGQAASFILAKYGMFWNGDGNTTPVNPFAAALARTFVGMVIIWLMVSMQGRVGKVFKSIQPKASRKPLLLGAVFCTISLILSLVSLSHTKAAISSTLMSLMPIMVIPIVYFKNGEKVSPRGILGTVISIIGVAVLMLF
ncbi:MAG: DMT family transporter [Acidobacteria bacterium]|nr:DMT family transporter [Acidobacteriota bacterium]